MVSPPAATAVSILATRRLAGERPRACHGWGDLQNVATAPGKRVPPPTGFRRGQWHAGHRVMTVGARKSTSTAHPRSPYSTIINGFFYPDRKSTRLNSSHLGISYAV